MTQPPLPAPPSRSLSGYGPRPGGTLLRLAPALPLLLSLSCQREGAREAAVLRDSAGITIVLNVGPDPSESSEWALSPEPLLSIGSVAGPEELQLYGIAGAHRLSDGRIGVVNAGSREVRFYGRGGEHLATYGTRGGGPEEFEMPALAGFLGDTLIVVDRAHHRLTLLHPDEGFVRLARVSDEVGGYLNPIGGFANGQTVFGGAFDMRRIEELHNGMNRAHTFYRSSNLDGSFAVDFGDQLGAEFFIKDLEGSGQDSRPAVIPFGKLPLAAVSRGRFYFSDQDGWEIEVRSPEGALTRLIRQEWEPVSVTAEDGALHIEDVVAQVGDPNQAPQIRQYLGALPLPDHFPPFGALMADLEGDLWVQDFQRPGAENRGWSIFDQEGIRVGRITLPDRFDPLEVGADYVLGLGWDEMNVEYLRLYSLRRPDSE
jgi:hypothetical protein